VRPSVCALIVTYGDRRHLVQRAIAGARSQGAQKVIVIGNGVSEDVLKSLALLGDGVRVVGLRHNSGSAGGWRVALEEAREVQADFIWLLDDDNVPASGCLDRLILAIQERDDFSAASPVREGDRLQQRVWNGALAEPGPGSFAGVDVRDRLRFRPTVRACGPSTRPVRSAPYGGLLLDAARFARSGCLPDAQWVLYEDDVDFTRRYSRDGGAIVAVRDALVLDIDTKWYRSEGSPVRLFYGIRNRYQLDRRECVTTLQRGWFFVNCLLVILRILSKNAIARDLVSIVALLKGLRAGHAARVGVDSRFNFEGVSRLVEHKSGDSRGNYL
jgi:GT2 family glycosyltransferase